jgi:hypothetical protein
VGDGRRKKGRKINKKKKEGGSAWGSGERRKE